jgi:uncharacterized LabA/DUF88 family protein
MRIKENNFAYIDGANLHKGSVDFGWKLDYARFRVWLSEKYGVNCAYIFIGLIPKYKDLYNYLQKSGFTLIFKEVVYNDIGRPKGNCDADLVLQAVSDMYENKFEKAVLVSSDGDYAGLVNFLEERKKILFVLSPGSEKKCSILLKRTGVKISYLKEQRLNLELPKKEKTPNKDRTL